MPATTGRRLINKILAYFAARGVLVGNLLILGRLTGGMLATANWLLRHDVWINPRPLITGMFIKGLLASRHGGDEHLVHDCWMFYKLYPDTPFQGVLVVLWLGVLFSAGH